MRSSGPDVQSLWLIYHVYKLDLTPVCFANIPPPKIMLISNNNNCGYLSGIFPAISG